MHAPPAVCVHPVSCALQLASKGEWWCTAVGVAGAPAGAAYPVGEDQLRLEVLLLVSNLKNAAVAQAAPRQPCQHFRQQGAVELNLQPPCQAGGCKRLLSAGGVSEHSGNRGATGPWPIAVSLQAACQPASTHTTQTSCLRWPGWGVQLAVPSLACQPQLARQQITRCPGSSQAANALCTPTTRTTVHLVLLQALPLLVNELAAGHGGRDER